jgi:hypothetical protein
LHRKRPGSNAEVRSELGARSEAVSLAGAPTVLARSISRHAALVHPNDTLQRTRRPALLLDFGPALAASPLSFGVRPQKSTLSENVNGTRCRVHYSEAELGSSDVEFNEKKTVKNSTHLTGVQRLGRLVPLWHVVRLQAQRD